MTILYRKSENKCRRKNYKQSEAFGWLKIGVFGSQPSLGEEYISTGSLYLCSAVFLPLGLSPAHPFWKDPDCDWTSKKIWSGQNVKNYHSI